MKSSLRSGQLGLTACLAGCMGFPDRLPAPLDCEDEQIDCIPPGMVEVPAGEFLRGTDLVLDEQPMLAVFIDTFFIDETELTVSEYGRCVESGDCTPPETAPGCNWQVTGREDHPVNCISWYQADQYCRWVDDGAKRLPTEAEWEKAVRGTDARKFPWGDLDDPSCEYAVMDDPMAGGPGCGTGGTMEVGSKPAGASIYGALDMAGNVGEWVIDWYDTQYDTLVDDNPTGPTSGTERVTRGGTWNIKNITDGSDISLRTSYRHQQSPEQRSTEIGCRCVRTTLVQPTVSNR